MADQPVYSTDKGFVAKGSAKRSHKKKANKAASKASSGTPDRRQPATIKVRLETKGRGGKKVTVVFNAPFSRSEAKAIKRELQMKFGCGATLRATEIELHGDWCEQVIGFFHSRGQKAVRAGG